MRGETKSLFLSLILLPVGLSAQSLTLLELRELYYEAAEDAAAAQRFHDRLVAAHDSTRAIILGYKGMADLMLANHALSPFDKFKHFVKGRDRLERALQREPDNLELRFLRFAVQTHAPQFLGYDRAIPEDKAFILSAVRQGPVDDDLRIRIIDYMLRTKHCTIPEKKRLAKNRR